MKKDFYEFLSDVVARPLVKVLHTSTWVDGRGNRKLLEPDGMKPGDEFTNFPPRIDLWFKLKQHNLHEMARVLVSDISDDFDLCIAKLERFYNECGPK
jgi:hypothetical protein